MTRTDPAPSTMATDSSSVAVVVVNFGAHALLARNLPTAAELGARVIVVDNRHSDAERDAVRALSDHRGWTMIAMPANDGFGAGVNAGMRHAVDAGCRALITVNPDAKITADVVAALAAHVVGHPDELVAPWALRPDGGVEFRGSRMYLGDGRIRGVRSPTAPPSRLPRPHGDAVEWIGGACFAAHRDLWQRLGGLAEHYFLYWEDVDLSYRARQLGARLVVRDDLAVVHDEGGTQGPRAGRAKSATYYYYNARNRLVFAADHLPPRQVVRWILTTPAVSREIVLRGGRRQLVRSTAPLRAIVRGSAAGLRIAVAALLRRRSQRAERSGRTG